MEKEKEKESFQGRTLTAGCDHRGHRFAHCLLFFSLLSVYLYFDQLLPETPRVAATLVTTAVTVGKFNVRIKTPNYAGPN